jgi:hypothetical protein
MRKPVVAEQIEKPKRNKLVLCKCHSQCAKHNPDGEYISRSTRDNHSRTDKLRAASEEASSPSSRWRLPIRLNWRKPSAPRLGLSKREDANRIKDIEAEVIWHSELPLIGPTALPVFDKEPLSSGEYTKHTIDDLLVPNVGMHSLREPSRANTAFLTTEYRLCELASKVQTMERTDDALAVLNRIYAELQRLDYQKQLHWNQQRAQLMPHKIVVNTGTMLNLLLVT